MQEMTATSATPARRAETLRAATQTAETISGARKAAILCVALGDEAASEIFKYLDEDEVQAISKELASINNIPSELANEIIEEFHQILTARTYVISGGVEYAKRLLIKAYGPEVARRLIDRITRSLESTVGFEALQKVDPQQLSKLFQNEHTQTIALVLAHLDASTAADTLQYLPESQRAEILLRMANLQPISQDVIRRVSVVLDQKLRSIGDYSRRAVGGIRPVAEICNRLDRDASRKILEDLEKTNAELALEIRNLMVTFDDLLLIDDVGIREILQRVDKRVLAMSLKGTSPEIQNRFFANMSSRAVEMLKEEMEYMGQVRVKDVSAAQREIVEIMRELDEKGIISLSGGAEEEYVS
ncbi:flagellar motor switch protein FliG [Pyrinomonas methylaliphatogenes]|jgi:flagellar motor switch protein FliG|uniref:Flagellar motor switch protein FliG n=2 Tax=Pyrinomonas methylaliphatogenes TaxID=454194 RepID=A0A0B6WX62_9BACT|nr:flagellar motor switch protein FliG [Pyrinomonas methylaliphatogenes]